MTAVFADTSFFIAFPCEDNADHNAALKAMTELSADIVTTQWVLVEVGNFLRKQSLRSRYAPFVERLTANPHVQIRFGDKESFQAGLKLYADRSDKDWSLTDCISFAVMGESGIREALTTDHHFVQAGFHALLV